MRQASFIDLVTTFEESIFNSIYRLGLEESIYVQALTSALCQAPTLWGEGEKVQAIHNILDTFIKAREAIASKLVEGEERRAVVNAFKGVRGNRFYNALEGMLEPAIRDGIIRIFLDAGMELSLSTLEEIELAGQALKDRGVYTAPAMLDIARLRVELEKASTLMKRIPSRHVDGLLDKIMPFMILPWEVVDSAREEHDNFSLYDQLGDLLSLVGAVAWYTDSDTFTSINIKEVIRFIKAIVVYGGDEYLLVNELVQYTDHAHDALEEWLQDERSLDNDETDLVPLLEEYYYHEEGVYPEHMSYAVDAVDQGICPNVFEAVAWIQSNMIGIYESTTDYAQQVLDEMENPDNLPLIKAEDYWEKELRYDISVLEDDSIKLLLVRS
jgi:hypothetical protein